MSAASKLMALVAVIVVPLAVLRSTARTSDGPDSTIAPEAGVLDACTVEAAATPLPAAIVESSGIARAGDGSLWTHNDGPEARLYRIGAAGAIEQSVALEGVRALDIEDIDAGPCPAGAGECLWLADTGDNDAERADVALFVVPLPAAAAVSTRPVRMTFAYPGGPRDAEALAVLPDGDAIVVTKGRDAPIEAYRIVATAGQGARAAPVAHLAAAPRSSRDRVTGGGASEDGRWIALRSNDRLMLHRTERLLAGDAAPALVQDLRPLRETQGEGVDVASDGTVWLTSEGERGAPTLARLRCVLPE